MDLPVTKHSQNIFKKKGIFGRLTLSKFNTHYDDTIICQYSKGQRRHWQSTPILLPGKSHGWRSLVGCSPWGRKESNTTEQLHFHSSLSCTGEGHGNPLQCSCLENPRDGGIWWAAIYGVEQSWTQLKRLSSSISSSIKKEETWASVVAQRLKHLPAMRETWVRSLGREVPLEKEMATHSSILASRIPRTEQPGRL